MISFGGCHDEIYEQVDLVDGLVLVEKVIDLVDEADDLVDELVVDALSRLMREERGEKLNEERDENGLDIEERSFLFQKVSSDCRISALNT